MLSFTSQKRLSEIKESPVSQLLLHVVTDWQTGQPTRGLFLIFPKWQLWLMDFDKIVLTNKAAATV